MTTRTVTRRLAVGGLAAAANAAAVPFLRAERASAASGYAFTGPAADRGLGLVPPAPMHAWHALALGGAVLHARDAPAG